MYLKRIFSAFLLLVWGVVFNSICSAAPLMVEKNLFANDRKPPPPESSDSSPKTAKPGVAIANIQLDGVIMQSNVKRAVLRMKNQPVGAAVRKGQPASPFVTVQEGQMVSDYRVSKIESKSISLEKDGQTFVVGLFAENKVVTPPAPQPPPLQQPAPAPGTAPQEIGAGRRRVQQVQPGFNPQNPQEPVPAQEAPAPPLNPDVAGNPAAAGRNQQNVPALPIPNQAVETTDQEE